jgi:molybdate transport system substrate-binding protein
MRTIFRSELPGTEPARRSGNLAASTTLLSGFLLAAALCGGCRMTTREAENRPVRLYAAASTIDGINEVATLFTEDYGIAVESSFAASSTQASMLIRGGKADLFLSASRNWNRAVAAEFPGSKSIALLGNELVIVVPAVSGIDVDSLEDLASPAIRKIAIADYNAVPAGVYARQALESAGLWESVSGKLVGAVDVRQALTMVENRVTDCGLVYASDALDNPHVRVVARVGGHSEIVYDLLLLPGSGSGARRFFEYLQSDVAKAIFRDHGFSIPAAPQTNETVAR